MPKTSIWSYAVTRAAPGTRFETRLRCHTYGTQGNKRNFFTPRPEGQVPEVQVGECLGEQALGRAPAMEDLGVHNSGRQGSARTPLKQERVGAVAGPCSRLPVTRCAGTPGGSETGFPARRSANVHVRARAHIRAAPRVRRRDGGFPRPN